VLQKKSPTATEEVWKWHCSHPSFATHTQSDTAVIRHSPHTHTKWHCSHPSFATHTKWHCSHPSFATHTQSDTAVIRHLPHTHKVTLQSSVICHTHVSSYTH